MQSPVLNIDTLSQHGAVYKNGSVYKKLFMLRNSSLVMLLIIITSGINAQNRINKMSVSVQDVYYSYGSGAGSLNNVVRLGNTLLFQYKTYDTVKARGTVYELSVSNPVGYYPDLIRTNRTVEVNDLYVNANVILPIVILYKGRVEHFFGVGMGVGVLADRAYYDQNDNDIAFDNVNFTKTSFGKHWTSNLILDYALDYKMTKDVGIGVGVRYFTRLLDGKKLFYPTTQGDGFALKVGLFFQFSKKRSGR